MQTAADSIAWADTLRRSVKFQVVERAGRNRWKAGEGR